MHCEDARQILWPDSSPAETPEAQEAKAHVAACRECQTFFRLDQVLSRRLADLCRPEECPQQVRVATSRRLRHVATPRRWRAAAWAAGALATAAVLLFLIRPAPMPQAVSMPLVAEARAGLPAGEGIVSSDMGTVERWLTDRLREDVSLPPIGEATLVGGRVATIGGVQTAVAVYHLHGQPLTYFALRRGEIMGVRPGPEVVGASADGYELALWSEAGQARAVVAPMPKRDVMAIAEECRRLGESKRPHPPA